MSKNRATQRRHNLKVAERRKSIIRDSKTAPCADCGVSYPSYVMDFDHVRGVKEFEIGKSRTPIKSPDKIRAEIAKCDIVCANCHRERTFGGESND